MGDRLIGRTIVCYNRTVSYYSNKKKKLLELLGNRCVSCGSDKKLQFDHINPKIKTFTITKNWSYSINTVLEELKKCQVLCEKCHKEKHSSKHGTISMYRHKKCRCHSCKSVWNEACKKWKKNR